MSEEEWGAGVGCDQSSDNSSRAGRIKFRGIQGQGLVLILVFPVHALFEPAHEIMVLIT